ncbi:MAG: hypothetical protein H0X16_00855 [Chloroflexi bacterium]|nr:hypothetical protein [Chloroflexota bacterium]
MTEDAAGVFDPIAIIRVLNEHRVRFVVIGGIAAGVQGAMWLTTDLDLVYARDRQDLTHLAAALAALDAEPIGLPSGVTVKLDERSLASGSVWTLKTRFGRLDLLDEPAPGLTYTSLAASARTIHGSATYPVASVDHLIAMNRTAGRPKDAGHLELLERVAQELRRDPPDERGD